MGYWKGVWSALQGKNISSSRELLDYLQAGNVSRSGVNVSWQTALQVTTVLACTRKLADGVSQVPWRVYQDDGSGKSVQNAHPLHKLIYRRPSPYATAYELRETMMLHLALTGNAYVWKGMVGRNRELRALELIHPSRVTIVRKDGELDRYTVRADDGTSRDFRPEEIWHVRGPSWDGVAGMDFTKLARDAIGLSMATEQTQAELNANGSRVSGLLSMDGKLSKEQFQFLGEWLDKHTVGGERAQKPLILDHGSKFTPFQMTGVDAQHLETRKHQIEEICRAFGVMPIMIGHADKTATYASAEQMFLAHVIHTLMPWYERLEQSADVNLLTEQEREQGFYTKFTPNALMRGAARDRAEFYARALGSGGHGTAWMVPNEIRGLEELDPIPGGDELNTGPQQSETDDAAA